MPAGINVAASGSMIFQTTLSGNEAHQAGATYPNRVKRARNWHALKASLVIPLLEVKPDQGLSASEAAIRRLHYGPNNSETLGPQHMTGMLLLLCSSMAGFLLMAAILNTATRDNMEAFAILAAVVIGAVIGCAHMLREAQAFDAMQRATRATVRVRRGGRDTNIQAEGLVPGDVVILGPGDCVPADARLIETAQLRAEESVLTGNHTAVDKGVSQVVTDAPLAQRQSMVYLGTTIDFGSAVAVVVATGVETELGKRVLRDN